MRIFKRKVDLEYLLLLIIIIAAVLLLYKLTLVEDAKNQVYVPEISKISEKIGETNIETISKTKNVALIEMNVEEKQEKNHAYAGSIKVDYVRIVNVTFDYGDYQITKSHTVGDDGLAHFTVAPNDQDYVIRAEIGGEMIEKQISVE